MGAQIPGMGKAGRVYTGIYRRYGKYPVYTGTCGVRRSLCGLPAPRRATARRAGPNHDAARTGAFPMIRKGSASCVGFKGRATRRGRAPAAAPCPSTG